MSNFIAKLETDPAAREQAGKVLFGAMGLFAAAALAMVAYLSWAI